LNIFTAKLREVLFSIIPITIIVILLKLTVVPIENALMLKFMISTVYVLFGLTFFLIGVDLGITPLGEHLSAIIAKKNVLWIVVVAAFLLGFIISIAEPGLLILGNQIDQLTSGAISGQTLLVVVSFGIGFFMIIGFLRIVYNFPLQYILLVSYGIIFILSLWVSPEFLAIAFDASGSTTGVLAVPFILSLSLGITAMKRDSKASEKDSFGLVAIVSAGAIIFVMVLSILVGPVEYLNAPVNVSVSDLSLFKALFQNGLTAVADSFKVFLPLIGILLGLKFLIKPKQFEFRRIFFGFIYALLGLSLFLTGVNTGFMDVGTRIGGYMVEMESHVPIVVVGFIIGVVTIIAEPAVYVLTNQIEEVTSGYVRKGLVLFALAGGVGVAIALSVLRVIVFDIRLWHYLLPGYLIALALTFVAPKLFVGIAFDAGGVATGPMTATFILAFINGAAAGYPTANILIDGFGMIAMVALMPIITLQLLGTYFKIKSVKKGVEANES
jgi:hypothetical protein